MPNSEIEALGHRITELSIRISNMVYLYYEGYKINPDKYNINADDIDKCKELYEAIAKDYNDIKNEIVSSEERIRQIQGSAKESLDELIKDYREAIHATNLKPSELSLWSLNAIKDKFPKSGVMQQHVINAQKYENKIKKILNIDIYKLEEIFDNDELLKDAKAKAIEPYRNNNSRANSNVSLTVLKTNIEELEEITKKILGTKVEEFQKDRDKKGRTR